MTVVGEDRAETALTAAEGAGREATLATGVEPSARASTPSTSAAAATPGGSGA